MALFQKSVIKTYLKLQDTESVQKAYKKHTTYFHNPVIQENIKGSKNIAVNKRISNVRIYNSSVFGRFKLFKMRIIL